MLRAMAVPSILVAVMRGGLLEKSRRTAFGVRCAQKIVGGVALPDRTCSGVRRTLHDERSLIALTPAPTTKIAAENAAHG
jgi:hypothetical protein